MINWKQKSPIEMANRIVAADIVRSITANKIAGIKDEKLRDLFLLPLVDEEGEEYYDVDWHFVIFEATDHQIGKLIYSFSPTKKNDKVKSLILDKNGQ